MNKNSSSSSNRRGPRGTARALRPSQVPATLRVIRKQRFIASAALTGSTVSVGDFVGMYQMAATATTGFPLFSAARVLAVEMWGPPGTTTPTSVALEWRGGSFSPHIREADTSIGATFPAHIRAVPPPNYLYSDFVDEIGTSSIMFDLTGPAGTVVDITAEFVLRNGEAPPAATTIVAATAGDVYVHPPDSARFLVPNNYLTF
jgi:hypothetical protein